MTAAQWLILASGAATLTGLALAACGIRERWRRFQHSLDITGRLRAAMLARPDPPQGQLVKVHRDLRITWDSEAEATYQPVSLPDIETDPQGFADNVRAALNKLIAGAKADRQRQTARVEAVKKHVGSELDDIREEAKIDAVFGYGWDFLGLLFLVAGAILGTIGEILAAGG